MFSLPYLLILVIYLSIFIWESKVANITLKKRSRLLCASLFIFFFGFRGLIGTDWYNYQYWYDEITINQWRVRDVELGFSFLGFLGKLFRLDYTYFQLMLVTIQVYLFDRFFSKFSPNISIAYIFLISLFPIVIIDLLRNFLAILIVMNGIIYLQQDNKKVFYLFVFGGMLFHITSIVYFVLPFLNKKHFGKNQIILLFVVGLGVYFTRFDFYSGILNFIGNSLGGAFKSLTDQAASDGEAEYGINIGILEKMILFFLIIFNYKELKKIPPLIFNSCLIYLFIYFYFGTSQSFINRFANLFMFGYILMYINLILIIKRYKYYLAFISYLFTFIVARTFLSYNNIIYKYSNRIFVEDNQTERIDNRNYHYEKR